MLNKLSLKSFSSLGIVLLSIYSVLKSTKISLTSLTEMVFSGFTFISKSDSFFLISFIIKLTTVSI